MRENSQLIDKKKAMTKEREFLKYQLQIMNDVSVQHKVIETALLCSLDMVEEVEENIWSTLPYLDQSSLWTKNCLAAFGNVVAAGRHLGSELYTLDSRNDRWVTHKALLGPIRNVFSNEKSIYILAGQNLTVYKWTVDSNTWDPVIDLSIYLKPLITGLSMVASEENIYVLGGLLNGNPVNTACVYNMKGDKWSSLPNMPFTSAICSSVLINNTLYVGGGISGDFLPVSEVSALSLNESNWRKLSPLNYGNATVTGFHDRLIASGGRSADGRDINNVEVFDIISNQWLPLPHMTTSRCFHGVCVTENNSLTVVGGLHNKECEVLKFQ